MKIIRPGKNPDDVLVDWACKNCNAVIRASKKEGQVQHDPSGRDTPAVVFKCPCCGVDNWVGLAKFR